MKWGVVIGDTHRDHRSKEHYSYSLVKKFIKKEHPDFVIHLGDWIDMEYLASFNREKLKKLEMGRLGEDYKLVKREIKWYQNYTDRLIYCEGNHEERIRRLIEREPKLEGLIEMEAYLDFDALGVEYYPLTEQPGKLGKLHFCHGWFHNKYHAEKHLRTYFGNIVYGHTHRFQTYPEPVPGFGTEIQAWGIACLTNREPDWMKGKPSGWQNGFGIIYLRGGGDFNIYPVNIIHGGFAWEGKEWKTAA